MRLACRLRRGATTSALALTLAACATWARQPVQQDPFTGGPVRVTRTDGSRVLLDSVTITADSTWAAESTVGRTRATPSPPPT